MFDWSSAALIGIIQGILEWLPVSSSGQTTIVMVDIFRINVELAITLGLAVHIGTALAVFVKYPKELIKMTKKNQSSKFYWITTVISLAIAFPIVLLLEQTFESEAWTGLTITLFIGIALILTGLLLSRSRKRLYKPISEGGLTDYVLLGLAQALAVLPGISRSGMTVGTLLIRGYKKKQALVFSFLLSVPVSVAASVYYLVLGSATDVGIWLFVIAAFFAFLFGFLSMSALVKIARSIRFSTFCIFFGGLAVFISLLIWTG
jgi:undecaprenyl-diphosphatase